MYDTDMSNRKLVVLETYKRTAMIPFDSTGIRVAFALENDVSNSARISITWHLLFAVIVITVFLCSLICYIFYKANTFVEYSDAFFPITTILISFIICIRQVYGRSKAIEMIENFELVIEERKSTQHR